MNINDIYATNDKIRENLRQTVEHLSDEQANHLPDGEKWTIANVVEHIAIVQEGMTRISGKLLAQAKSAGKQSNGTANLSDNFQQKSAEAKNLKFEAPERIHPTGKLTIAESLEKMRETRAILEDLRSLFESVDCTDFKFPHPFMGELSAHEWLTLIGGHERRHLAQIENLLSNLDNK